MPYLNVFILVTEVCSEKIVNILLNVICAIIFICVDGCVCMEILPKSLSMNLNNIVLFLFCIDGLVTKCSFITVL